MKVINADNGQATMQFTGDEFRIIANSLNEILNGFSCDLSGTGWTKPDAGQLHDYVLTNYNRVTDNKIICSFTNEEIAFLIQAINATIDELDWEFSIRVGNNIEEAQQLQAQLQEACNC